jgi:hypothetical protein
MSPKTQERRILENGSTRTLDIFLELIEIIWPSEIVQVVLSGYSGTRKSGLNGKRRFTGYLHLLVVHTLLLFGIQQPTVGD